MEELELCTLKEALISGTLAARRDAVRKLAEGRESAIPFIISLLQEPVENEVRWYAAVALVRIGTASIQPLIDAIFANTEPLFRRYAAAALGHIGEPAVAPLLEAMKRADPATRGFLSLALCRIGDPAIPAIQAMLSSPDPVMRECATLTLWQMGQGGIESLLSSVEEEARE